MILILLAASSVFQTFGNGTFANATFAKPNTPLKHIVIIMQENHSFDNYFGKFPTLSKHFALDETVCLPVNQIDPSQGCVHPWRADSKSQAVESIGLAHSLGAAIIDYNGGKMDQFVSDAFRAGITNSTTKNYPVAYFTNYTLPNYWDYAQFYALDANFFSSSFGPSYPNHLYLVSGQSGGITGNTPTYNLEFNNIANVMSNSNVDWKYYSGGWNTQIDCVSPINGTYLSKMNFSMLQQYWNVLFDFPSIQKNTISCHNLLATPDFFSNVTNGYLPQVSWIIPGGRYSSEHPCNICGNDITQGQEYVSAVINAIESNQTLYSSTAIFLTWDDFGGYYDHIVPNKVDGFGYSFREPLIVISPYVKHGVTYGLNGKQTDFTAFLKTIETNWNLPSLTSRDGNAYSLTYMFNFTQTPIKPVFMPSGQLGVYPVASCILHGLCHKGSPTVAIKDLIKSIPASSGINDDD